MRNFLLGAFCGVLLIGAGAWIAFNYMPAWSAERLYRSMPYSDSEAKCETAHRAAEAWAVAGKAEHAAEWRSKAEPHCAMARLTRGLAVDR